jgi:hypothetical protein
MSDKLNKLGFLAGRLFAKTVNEVKPLLNKDEPSHTDPAPILSAEEKIKKVLELLETKKVSKNIENLLNRHDFRFDEIVVKQRKYLTSSSLNEVEGLNASLIQELEIKEINKHLYFEYKEKTLHIFLANDTSGSFPDGDTYNLCELIVIYNGTCVLKDSISKETDLYGSVYRVGGFHSLKSFKNGSWMDDLNYLIRNFDYSEKIRKSNEVEKKQKQIADNLDLDPLD